MSNPALREKVNFSKRQRLLTDPVVERQSNLCAICHLNESEVDKRNGQVRWLAVDHDHATGRIRGLLCSHCNKAIGLFQENPEFMKAAIEYLAAVTAEV